MKGSTSLCSLTFWAESVAVCAFVVTSFAVWDSVRESCSELVTPWLDTSK